MLQPYFGGLVEVYWLGFSVNVKFKAFGKMDKRKQSTNAVRLIFLHVFPIMVSVRKTDDQV